MNAGKYKIVIRILLIMAFSQAALADSARVLTSQGNELYEQGNFNEAINSYNQALSEAPGALEPKFNQANSYYRLDDLSKAMDLYRQVAAESKDMKLVARAKYNLGNSYFQEGSKQKDSNLQKAIDDLKTAISSWRGVLDIEPENKKAAKNIEVARLTIKDLLDQLNKQRKQQDANQPQSRKGRPTAGPNQQKQQNQSQKQKSQQNPNQAQEQKNQQQSAAEEPNQPQEPNQPEKEKQKQEAKKQQQKVVPDTTAQEILDKEQRQRKERQILQPGPWQEVEKDW